MDEPPFWPFEDPPNVAAITSRAILDGDDWIALVSHDDDDGSWQFLGPGGAPDDSGQAAVVALRRLFELDSTIAEVADLPYGWQAWRERPDEPWQRASHDD